MKLVVQGVNGVYRAIYVPAFYFPSSQQRIVSTQVLFKEYPGSECLLDSEGFVWNCGRRAPGLIISPQDGLHLAWCYTLVLGNTLESCIMHSSQTSGEFA